MKVIIDQFYSFPFTADLKFPPASWVIKTVICCLNTVNTAFHHCLQFLQSIWLRASSAKKRKKGKKRRKLRKKQKQQQR